MTASIRILHGDCLALLSTLAPESVDSIVTDPPYGLSSPPPIEAVLRAWLDGLEYRAKKRGFMGHTWDAFVPGPEVWRECFRVLKPGGHLLAFFGSRTVDVGGLAIRLAGFEIRDQIQWLYGQGFPKSLDVSKAIDKIRDDVDDVRRVSRDGFRRDTPATPEAAQWGGWGTALKPAHEPIVLARKPLAEGTVAAQVLATGTGAINVDGCRVGTDEPAGRWPANVILDEEAAAMLDEQSGYSKSPTSTGRGAGGKHGRYRPLAAQGRVPAPGDAGGASRFFYCAKASKAERGEGNAHPTVKPLSLMRWLVRLVTPPQGLVLDPFAGSGTTLLAAREEGFDALGVEQDADYVEIIRRRLGESSC